MCAEIVDLIRLNVLNDPDEVCCIGQIAVMEDKIAMLYMRILIEFVYAVGVELRRAPLDAVYDIALIQKQFGEICAVLSGDAGN